MAFVTTGIPAARLLVVEDEPNIRELLATSLRFAGFEVHSASQAARLTPCTYPRKALCRPPRHPTTQTPTETTHRRPHRAHPDARANLSLKADGGDRVASDFLAATRYAGRQSPIDDPTANCPSAGSTSDAATPWTPALAHRATPHRRFSRRPVDVARGRPAGGLHQGVPGWRPQDQDRHRAQSWRGSETGGASQQTHWIRS
jgi:hypothetical protein